MKYMLLEYLDEEGLTETEWQECYRDSAGLARELAASGNYLTASLLHLTTSATTVRLRGKMRLVTDGPFAETGEQLGGYYLIEANDLDEAINIAARVPIARFGAIEVRPVMDIPGLPASWQDF